MKAIIIKKKTCSNCLQTFHYGPFCVHVGEVDSKYTCNKWEPIKPRHHIRFAIFITKRWLKRKERG